MTVPMNKVFQFSVVSIGVYLQKLTIPWLSSRTGLLRRGVTRSGQVWPGVTRRDQAWPDRQGQRAAAGKKKTITTVGWPTWLPRGQTPEHSYHSDWPSIKWMNSPLLWQECVCTARWLFFSKSSCIHLEMDLTALNMNLEMLFPYQLST